MSSTAPLSAGRRASTRPRGSTRLRAVADPAGQAGQAVRAEPSSVTCSGSPCVPSPASAASRTASAPSARTWMPSTHSPAGSPRPGKPMASTLAVGQFNAYLADCLDRHTQGGTVTKQGNLRVFLKHLAEEYVIENGWDHPKRHRYGRQEQHPPVLPPDLITALLKATSGKTFEDRRDHAIIRVLLSGPRRQEVASMRVELLDLRSAVRTVGVIGLKGRPSRSIMLGDKDVLALKRWLSLRARHRCIRSPEEGPAPRRSRSR
ncbi:MAG: hypothetical protein QOG10_2747 [Kribbellaceae bacterium]|nr:hypothetical protein [Kribbellaceae bacterium]